MVGRQRVCASTIDTRKSWNSEVVVPVIAGLLVAGLIGFVIWYSANYDCVEWEQKWVCNTRTLNEGTSYSSVETVCGWEDYCTRREKK